MVAHTWVWPYANFGAKTLDLYFEDFVIVALGLYKIADTVPCVEFKCSGGVISYMTIGLD